jgi:hypothetical protein
MRDDLSVPEDLVGGQVGNWLVADQVTASTFSGW